MKFSFIILTWNRKLFLEICLDQLLKSIGSLDDAEVVIMDNGSTDGTQAFLEAYENRENIKIVKLDKNYGLNSYKKLIGKATGEYIIVVDDDVLAFPDNIKQVFESYMTDFPEFGFLALDVVQNEYTNGAKPTVDFYTEIEKNGKIVQQGPTGGWCTCFRRRDFKKISILFYLKNLNMKSGEDGTLSRLFNKWLKLKSGVIKDQRCFHASGPHYSKQYGCLDRDIEKYREAGLDSFVRMYTDYK